MEDRGFPDQPQVENKQWVKNNYQYHTSCSLSVLCNKTHASVVSAILIHSLKRSKLHDFGLCKLAKKELLV